MDEAAASVNPDVDQEKESAEIKAKKKGRPKKPAKQQRHRKDGPSTNVHQPDLVAFRQQLSGPRKPAADVASVDESARGVRRRIDQSEGSYDDAAATVDQSARGVRRRRIDQSDAAESESAFYAGDDWAAAAQTLRIAATNVLDYKQLIQCEMSKPSSLDMCVFSTEVTTPDNVLPTCKPVLRTSSMLLAAVASAVFKDLALHNEASHTLIFDGWSADVIRTVVEFIKGNSATLAQETEYHEAKSLLRNLGVNFAPGGRAATAEHAAGMKTESDAAASAWEEHFYGEDGEWPLHDEEEQPEKNLTGPSPSSVDRMYPQWMHQKAEDFRRANPRQKRPRKPRVQHAYDKERFREALQLVKDGAMSCIAAAKKFGVPRGTLRNHVLGITKDEKCGRKQALTMEEETQIVRDIVARAESGRTMSRQEIALHVKSYLDLTLKRDVKYFKYNLPGRRWVENFLRRHDAVKASYLCSADKETLNVYKVIKKIDKKDDILCPECGQKFDETRLLKTHVLRFHTANEEMPFMCDSCGKGFFTKQKLEIHRNVHTGDKPFQCQYCAYASGDPTNLRKHEKGVHSKGLTALQQKTLATWPAAFTATNTGR